MMNLEGKRIEETGELLKMSYSLQTNGSCQNAILL